MERFLAETCLLTHGLASVTDNMLRSVWPERFENLTWIEHGAIRIGSIEEYLTFRAFGGTCGWISCFNLQAALDQGKSGALTASGTMEVCRRMEIPLAVTCGMGGIGDIRGEELCPDLPALRDIPVTLISTSPKDVLDIQATLDWLFREGVSVYSADSDRCTGYLFRSADIPLPHLEELSERPGKLLILNGIPEKDRIQDLSLIPLAVQEAKREETSGKAFHPAANAAFDRLTDGYSSRIQLKSFIRNVLLAERLAGEKAAES